MVLRRLGGFSALVLLAAVPQIAAPPASHAGGFGIFRKRQDEPKPPVVMLAEQIDELEKSLNETGTVVAKKPDVWGESRMTKHRQEVEDELAERLDKFELLLNASVSRSDAAFFANAFTLQAAIGGGALPSLPTVPSPTAATSLIIQNPSGGAENSDVLVRTTPGAMQIATRTGTEAGALSFASTGIGLEPTIQLDQLKRYLDHLNELRRLNEGGDTADAPGYALNLVRIPVSVLPGDDTRIGHGAEITVTAEAHLTPELLPPAFRTLVIQDLVDQLSLPVLKIAEARAWTVPADPVRADALKSLGDRIRALISDFRAWLTAARIAGQRTPDLEKRLASLGERKKAIDSDLASLQLPVTESAPSANAATTNDSTRNELLRIFRTELPPASSQDYVPTALNESHFIDLQAELAVVEANLGLVEQQLVNLEQAVTTVQNALSGAVAALPTSSSSNRVARYAVPPSQLVDVFGKDELLIIAEKFEQFRAKECGGRRIQLSDARAFLGEELQAAYDFLLSPTGVCHWTCAPTLSQAIRSGEVPVEDRITVTCGGQNVTRSLAWAILVEAALLNDRLNEDMQRVSGDPDCNCMYGGPYVFLGPDPPTDARYAFMDYVRCRWPIHVFALDPVNQDQNIADDFSMRRELQLSAAVALASGNISASNAMRFVRQIALDQETIALNTTAAAFAHGANTFGWRFYPRFQTAEIESNSAVLFRDLLCGGPNRDQLLKDYRIEPGMRECVALVVMPSFVPHVRFDIRSNWFELTDPEDTQSSMVETVELSRKIRDMQRLTEICSIEADSYRPGDMERLFARVKQLSDKLPLQTVYSQVPYENTAGGFELFSSGVTDLGPELIDFYGAPGINQDANTELFVVGRNFSVHETKVIAGNKVCHVELLSRDVMKVTVPSDVQTVVCSRTASDLEGSCAKCRTGSACDRGCYEAVELHLATPYGVSGRLMIPALPKKPTEAQTAAAATAKALEQYQAIYNPISYDWSTKELNASLCFDESTRLPVSFCLQGALAVKFAKPSPFGPSPVLEFAGYVYDAESGAKIGNLPKCYLQYDSTNKLYELDVNRCVSDSGPAECPFVDSLWSVLRQGGSGIYPIKAIVVSGYVRCPQECPNGIRLASDLVIKLDRCQPTPCMQGGECECHPVMGASKGRVFSSEGSVVSERDVPLIDVDSTPELPLPSVLDTISPSESSPVNNLPTVPAPAPAPESVPTAPQAASQVVPVLPTATLTSVPGQALVLPTQVAPLPPTIAIESVPPVAVPVYPPQPKKRHRLFDIFHKHN